MIDINSKDELDKNIMENKDSIIMLLFAASWCSPCKKLKNRLLNPDELKNLPKLLVLYIDTDTEDEELKTIMNNYDITNVPTQIFIKLDNNNIKFVDKIIGSDWIKLQMIYNSYDLHN
jgi:thiol:disulfide interchange protein